MLGHVRFGLPQNLRYLIGIDGNHYARIGVHCRARAVACVREGRVFVRECARAVCMSNRVSVPAGHEGVVHPLVPEYVTDYRHCRCIASVARIRSIGPLIALRALAHTRRVLVSINIYARIHCRFRYAPAINYQGR